MAYQQSSKTVVVENTGLNYASAYRFKLIKIVLTFPPGLTPPGRRLLSRLWITHRPSGNRFGGTAITNGTVTWTINRVYQPGSLIITLQEIGGYGSGFDWKKDRAFWGKIYVELM